MQDPIPFKDNAKPAKFVLVMPGSEFQSETVQSMVGSFGLYSRFVTARASGLDALRDLLAKLAIAQDDYTHAIWCDTDTIFTREQVITMCESAVTLGLPVLSAVITSKEQDPAKRKLCFGTVLGKLAPDIYQVSYVGFGFVVVDLNLFRSAPNLPRFELFGHQGVQHFFPCGVSKQPDGSYSYFSEDAGFSALCSESKVPLAVHMGVRMGHIGLHRFDVTDEQVAEKLKGVQS